MGALNIIKRMHFQPVLGTFRTPIAGSRPKSAESDLALPEKPKRPGNVYTKFVKSCRSGWVPNGEESFLKYCSNLWSTLSESEKSKYAVGYETEYSAYKNALEKYYAALTDNEKKLLSILKTKTLDNSKPKKPGGVFYLFVQEQMKRPEFKKSNMKEIFVACSKLWHSIPEAERQKYQQIYNANLENYQKLLQEWKGSILSKSNKKK